MPEYLTSTIVKTLFPNHFPFVNVQSMSMTNRGGNRTEFKTNLLYEFAASPAEIKARLAGVPVYAVVNSKKEFILVSGDDDSSRQLSLLFFNKADAEGFQETVRLVEQALP